ncbi:hypothetical protein GIB67_025367 [Kingdonia uniflora]|uniref:U-box domain-containing protein n=1 Tax=Kingdonia uniflora TaxID=39325 RepID=A0A7J7NBB7_9MAGN|nr:hypothetical protein GIB67_025367 [Kingdonia uniflora]
MTARLRQAVGECLTQSKSEFTEVQEKALQNLVALTKFSPQNRSIVAESDGAITTIAELSKSTSKNIQSLSLSVLFNLSLNDNLKLLIADMETLRHLNSIILAPSSSESGMLAASLICSLAMLDKNKAKFGVSGTIQALVKTLDGPCSSAAHHLLSSLAELVVYHGNSTMAVRSGAVSVLLQVVESTNGEDLGGSSLAILVLLARYEEGINTITNTEGVVSLLVDVLKRRCMLSKEGSAELLLRMLDESEGCLRDAVRLPELSSVLADISVRGSAKAREKANMLMKKMMDANMQSYMDTNPMFYHW